MQLWDLRVEACKRAAAAFASSSSWAHRSAPTGSVYHPLSGRAEKVHLMNGGHRRTDHRWVEARSVANRSTHVPTDTRRLKC